jgi:hypothetical protein
MRASAMYCLLGSTVVGCASSVLWAAGAETPWLGGLFGLSAGFLGAFVFCGVSSRQHA